MNKKVPPIKQKNKKGFTLIELLVVVAIIGTLMSLISVSYLDIRAKSRDARRVNDVKSLRDGMALYQIQHTVYPLSQNETAIDGGAAVLSKIPLRRLSITHISRLPTGRLILFIIVWKPIRFWANRAAATISSDHKN